MRGSINKNFGFSLLEMILAVTLSGFVIAAAMTLVLTFSNNYIASQRSEMRDRQRVCREKFLKISLIDYRLSKRMNDIEASLLESGIFWETNDLHAFESHYHHFIAGLYLCDNKLYFLWLVPEDKDEHELTDRQFEKFELFDDVRSVCLLTYDLHANRWTERRFRDKTVRKYLEKNTICYLRIKRENDTMFLPLFGI